MQARLREIYSQSKAAPMSEAPPAPTVTIKLSAWEQLRTAALKAVVEINDGFEVADMIALAEWILGTDHRGENVPDEPKIPVFGEPELQSLTDDDDDEKDEW